MFSLLYNLQAQALDSVNQQLEYYEVFQPPGSSYTSDSLAVIDEQKTVVNSDDRSNVLPEDESALSLHLDDDSLDSTSQHSLSHDQLPSPRSVKPSLSFFGKKTTKFMWTGGHLRILQDILEFTWGIIENWKRFLNYYVIISYCKSQKFHR